MITVLSLSPAVDKIYFVEGFRAGGLYRVRDAVKSAGGKGINVARMAAALGEEVSVIGFKAGETGRWLEESVRKLGVETAFIEVEGESRTNNNIIDRTAGTETEVLETGPYIDGPAVEEFLGRFSGILQKTDVLVCSGGLPEGIPADFYRRLIGTAKPLGIEVLLDSSGETLSEGIKAGPGMIKPNRRELGRYVGRDTDTDGQAIEACKSIVAGGVGCVLASRGSEGALLVTGREVLKAKVPDIPVVNTIGSGDAAVAGFAAARNRGEGYEAALRLAMACAVANTQFREIGVVSGELVRKYSEEIEIKYIKE